MAKSNPLYQWQLSENLDPETGERFPQLSAIALQLLFNRHLTQQEDIDRFLNPDYGQDQYDPFLFNDMHKVVARIQQALKNQEKIVVHGDYDADGVSSAAILFKTLKKIGAQVDVYLPHRDTEGYGLNKNTVQTLFDNNTNLIITVDCGISNQPEIAQASALGMEVIVTDHHAQPPTLPDKALAILNPVIAGEKYPFKNLAGVGVAFKLCQALITTFKLGEAFEKWLLDIVSIATIADYVNLISENRVFTKYGLMVLRKNKRPGLQQLFATMGVDAKTADTQTVSYKIAPHLNAAGRMKHANAAFELLIEEDAGKAKVLAESLAQTNKKRQAISEKAAITAQLQVKTQQDDYLVVVEDKTCPVGLVGLVAGKITTETNRPALVITRSGEEIMGSGRSIEQFNLIKSLQTMDELFVKYGGHPMACGFTLKNEKALAEFILRIKDLAKEQLAQEDLRKILHIEKQLNFTEINWELVALLEQFSPYGEGNAEPLFLSRKVKLLAISAVGKKADHLKLVVSQGGIKRPGIGFGFGKLAKELAVGTMLDLVYRVSVNEWNGNREI
ncbi:MAG: single-stranded-DNA-specific exonuclease RecJ, partial [Candidatus Kerfeldbacteria bacterium RIFOXYC2_FULL_38_9]